MEEPTTLIRVKTKTAEKLAKLYGKPQWMALDKALKNAPCNHPEDQRTYVSAEIPAEGTEAIEETLSSTIHGFHCASCGKYIFPDKREE